MENNEVKDVRDPASEDFVLPIHKQENTCPSCGAIYNDNAYSFQIHHKDVCPAARPEDEVTDGI